MKARGERPVPGSGSRATVAAVVVNFRWWQNIKKERSERVAQMEIFIVLTAFAITSGLSW